MSFSAEVKAEIARADLGRSCCQRAELAAALHLSGSLLLLGEGKVSLQMHCESALLARRVYLMIKNLYSVKAVIEARQHGAFNKRRSYNLQLQNPADSERILKDLCIWTQEDGLVPQGGVDSSLVRKICCRRAFMRGAFLCSGSVSQPDKGYHLEIVTATESFAQRLCDLMVGQGLNARVAERKGGYIVYLKEGDHIVRFLALTQAHSAVLKLENVRIVKDMRNRANRAVNCETANLDKTVGASARQIESISLIERKRGLQSLTPQLREIAEIRLNYPEASLNEIASLVSGDIGRSGINHRLRRLEHIAQEIREEEGENS